MMDSKFSRESKSSNTMPEIEYLDVLGSNLDLLLRCLVVSPRLVLRLIPVDFFRDKLPEIDKQQTHADKVESLLGILGRVTDCEQQKLVFNKFLVALRQDGQEHVANVFRAESDARPMSDEHYQLLISKQKQISVCLDPQNGLVEQLVDQKVLSDSEGSRVLSRTGYSDLNGMSREFIDILLRKQDSAFDMFIGALCSTKQEHVACLLGHQTAESPMTPAHRGLLVSKTGELCQFIDPSIRLLNALVDTGDLSKRDMECVRSRATYDEMSLELVNILLRKPDSSFIRFIEALNNAEQQHVVHILTGQGESPLSRVRRLVLRKARDRLISRVGTFHTSLLTKLISCGVLNDCDKQRIEAQTIDEDRVGLMTDVVARKSQHAYDKFIQALKDSGHQQIAEELEGLELRGEIDPHFLSDTLHAERNKIVEVVRNNMKSLVCGTGDGINEIRSLMEQNGFVVSDISEGSIRIRLRCFTAESLANLKRLYADKTLDKLFTQVFCPQFAEQGLESLTLHISEDQFDECAEMLTVISSDDYLETMRSEATQRIQQPVELLELVLMKPFIKLFTLHHKSHEAIRLAYCTLATVCHNWWQTMNGWPESPTRHWFKHKLFRYVKCVCRPYLVSPRLKSSLSMSSDVCGVTQCDNKLFVVCSNAVDVYGANNEALARIALKGLQQPTDIVSCSETKLLYVAGESGGFTRCVWRVSLDGRQIEKWLPNESTTTSSQFRPWTLSVTSRRLLVASQDNAELQVFGADGAELERVSLENMHGVRHAVETSRGSFVVSHWRPQPRVCEVNVDGHVINVYNNHQQLGWPVYLSLDSEGRVFVADFSKQTILMLNSRLELERVLLDESQHRLTGPSRLCYTEQTGQLVVSSRGEWDASTGRLPGRVQLFIVR